MIDISGISYFMPIYGFLIVFLIIYALLAKTKLLGGVMWIDLLIALIIAAVFSTFASAQSYVQNIIPWFAILVIALLLMLVLIGLGGKIETFFKPGFLWVFVIVLILVFVVAAIKIFPNFFGSVWESVNQFATGKSRIFGGIVLMIIAALVAWVIVKK